MIAYSLNAIASQCNNNLSPNLAKLCHKVELKTYFDNKDKIDPYLETSQFKDTKFLLSCENIVRFYETLKEPTLEVKLNFAKKSPVITFNNQDQDLKLASNEPISISKPIGEFKFSKDQETNEYSVNFNFKPQEVYNENVQAKSDDFKKCDSLTKLSSAECRGFLKKIDKQYFSVAK